MKELLEINKELWRLANDAERYTPENMRIAIQDICSDLRDTTEQYDDIVDAAQEIIEHRFCSMPDTMHDRIQTLDEMLNKE